MADDEFHVFFEALDPSQQQKLLTPLLEAGYDLEEKGNEATLKKWWATHFNWGTPGDFDACVAKATEVFGKNGVAIDPKAWCARMHKDVTGASPGHAPGEGGGAKSKESENLPAPDEDVLLAEDDASPNDLSEAGSNRVYHWKHGWIPLDHAASNDSGTARVERVKQQAIAYTVHDEHGKIVPGSRTTDLATASDTAKATAAKGFAAARDSANIHHRGSNVGKINGHTAYKAWDGEWYVIGPDGKATGEHFSSRAEAVAHMKSLKAKESEDAVSDHQLVETAESAISERAAAEVKKSGRMIVQLISPGWGSSGYYSPAVLEDAANRGVIAKGTHMYADHPTEAEAYERPGRSIKDLMAVTLEDAKIGEGGALVAPVKVVPAWRELVEDVHEHIGVSIRGDATDIKTGEAEGRQGKIIEGLAHVSSVDFVTRAGRGGKVLKVLEAAQTNQRALDRGISEATVNDTRDALQDVLNDAYGSTNPGSPYVYVCDFDDSNVWFQINGETFGQAYTGSGTSVELAGAKTEVRRVTSYIPTKDADDTGSGTSESATTHVPDHPAGQSTTQGDTMGTIQIEEAVHNDLVETAGRVPVLEQERDTALAERDAARNALAERDRRDAAVKIIEAADAQFTPLEVKGLLGSLPVKESGELDEETFKTTVAEESARVLEAGGAGRVRGFGGRLPGELTESVSDEDLNKLLAGTFGRETGA